MELDGESSVIFADRLGIKAIPALFYILNEKVIAVEYGLREPEEIKESVDYYLKPTF